MSLENRSLRETMPGPPSAIACMDPWFIAQSPKINDSLFSRLEDLNAVITLKLESRECGTLITFIKSSAKPD